MITIHDLGSWPEMKGRSDHVDVWREGSTIADFVPERYRDNPNAVCMRLGKLVKPDDWSRFPVEYGDDLVFVTFPGDLISLTVWVIQQAIPYFVTYAIGMAINNAFGVPDQPTAEDAPDPTYAFTGIENTASNGIPIPVVYGSHKVGGNYIDVSLEGNNPYLTGQQFGNLLDVTIGVCAGPISSFESTKINGNDLVTYNNTIDVEYNLGTEDQTALTSLGSASTFNVGLTLNDGAGDWQNPSTWTGGEARTYTTSTAVDRVRLNILHPEGLVAIHHSSGAHVPVPVAWEVRYRIADPVGAFTPWESYQTTSNVRSPFTTVTEITFPGREVYDVQVRKNWVYGAPIVFSRIDLDSVTEILNTNARYPLLATSHVRVEADTSLSGTLPTITQDVIGKVITKWDGVDPDNPNFIDAGPKYNNPAWVALDVLLDEVYGLGRWLTAKNVDLYSFQDWANWCDELVDDGSGSLEARCEFDAVFDGSGRDAWHRLLQICSTARASLVVVGDLIKVKVERERTPTQAFTMGNIVNDSWSQDWISNQRRSTRIEVVYLNKALDYQRDAVGIDDPDALEQGLPQRTERIELMGITRESQALREARFRMNLQKLTRTCRFAAGIDSIVCEVGDLVRVSHDVPQWGFSGRIAQTSTTPSTAILDRDVTLEAGESYELLIKFEDDTVQSFDVTNATGTYAAGESITLAQASTRGITKSLVYSFGKKTQSTQIVKITEIQTRGDLYREISGIVYDDRIHDDAIGELDPIDISELPDPGLVPACVGNLQATVVNQASGGAVNHQVQVTWEYPTGNIGSATVWFRDLTGANAQGVQVPATFNWIQLGTVTYPQNYLLSSGFEVGSTYEFTALAASTSGATRAPGQCSTVTLEVTPESLVVPDAPTNIAVSHSGDELVLTWNPVTNAPISHYEVRRGAEWVGSLEVGESVTTTLITERWAPTANSSIQENFFIRAVSQAGQYGNTGEITLNSADLPIWTGGTAVQQNEASSTWPGSRTNLSLSGSRLVVTDPIDSASYLTSSIDAGSAGTWRIGAVCHMSQSSGFVWDNLTGTAWTSTVGQTNGWIGFIDPDLWRSIFSIEFQASANNIAFSNFVPLVTQNVPGATVFGNYITGMRYFRVRVTLTPSDLTFIPYLDQLYITLESR